MGKPEYVCSEPKHVTHDCFVFGKAWLHFSRRMPLNKGPMGSWEANYHVFAFKRQESRSGTQCGVAPPRDEPRTRSIRPT